MDRYILEIWDGVDPLLTGPYASERNRIRGARRRRAKDPDRENTLFRVSVSRTHTGTKVDVDPFFTFEMEPK